MRPSLPAVLACDGRGRMGPVRPGSRCMPQPESTARHGGLTGLADRMSTDRDAPDVPGILTASQIVATGRAIAAVQQHDGSIGWPDGHVDAWNHVECAMALSVCGLRREARRAYAWLVRSQQSDGSWPVWPGDGAVAEWSAESIHAAYCAVGVWHELLVTGDEAFAAQMWPVVRAGIEFAIGLQT